MKDELLHRSKWNIIILYIIRETFQIHLDVRYTTTHGTGASKLDQHSKNKNLID